VRASLAGKRETVKRLAIEVRRRLEPLERAVPISLPGGPPDRAGRAADAALNAGSGASDRDPAARIDAARERLRAAIQPPDERGEDR
jgi:hypothetical protein